MDTIKDKCVLVTGAGRGIGKRLAIGFASHGARVGLLARSKAELDLAHLEIEHAGGLSLRLRGDVTDYEQLTAQADRLRLHYGDIQILVCAAAVQGPIGPFVDSPLRSWTDAVQINLFGVMNACRAVLPRMIENRSGKIVVLSGGGAATPRPGFSAYAASKAAVVRFAETLAEEVQEHNIQVNCMSPGGTYTHMTDEILRAGEKAGWREVEEAEQIRRTGGIQPEKQIQLALFLASEMSNHISGKLIHVNDDWKKLKNSTVPAELYTLRRMQKG